LYTVTAKTGSGKTGLLVSSALAVVTGSGEMILGREVTQGRVAYIAAENPDDLRMRIMVAAFLLNLDLEEVANRFVILDKRMPPEELQVRLTALSADGHGPFTLIMVDTLAAFFDGGNINDPVQGGNFMRKLRPLTMLPRRPSVLVAAHPTKNASDDNLIPYGAGAILNEVDGNLTLRREGETTNLHWQGKLRGVEFAPALFKFEIAGCPAVKDIKGREVQLPVLRPCEEREFERKQTDEVNKDAALLRAMIEAPTGTQRDWATRTSLSRSVVNRCLVNLKAEKLVDIARGLLVWNCRCVDCGTVIDGTPIETTTIACGSALEHRQVRPTAPTPIENGRTLTLTSPRPPRPPRMDVGRLRPMDEQVRRRGGRSQSGARPAASAAPPSRRRLQARSRTASNAPPSG
jgi:hypothetical protein